eukprot:3199614-Prymnesium_polylepis.1
MRRHHRAHLHNLPIDDEERGEHEGEDPIADARVAGSELVAPSPEVEGVHACRPREERRQDADLRQDAERGAPTRRAVCKVALDLLAEQLLKIAAQPHHQRPVHGGDAHGERAT